MSKSTKVSVETTTQKVLRYLIKHGTSSAGEVGSVIDKRHGRIAAVQGGGDYAAQMLLGRMRKAGLVRTIASEGSSRWEVTSLGRREAKS